MTGAAAPARKQVLGLYHKILKEAASFQDYNFRETALRKAKTQFRANRSLTGHDAAEKYAAGLKSVAQLHRCSVLQQLYPTKTPYIVEQNLKHPTAAH